MQVRADGTEITDEDADTIASGVTSVMRDPLRSSTVWVDFGNGYSCSGIRYVDGSFGWDRPEVIEADTLAAARALFT